MTKPTIETFKLALERIAATGTADSFMALPDAQKRLWFANYVNESSLRKKALLSLEEYEHAPSHVGRERCVIEAVAYLSGLTIAQPVQPADMREVLAHIEAQDAEIARLQKAAQAVLDRWDSPAWEWQKHGPTADLMTALRAALTTPKG